jgi:hypothetical protein
MEAESHDSERAINQILKRAKVIYSDAKDYDGKIVFSKRMETFQPYLPFG